ncbi:hypothetical protein M2163_005915 [Streptomyces sp. SAI-135]|nr:hypothetical protein [Streptomyces sp. SAI-090]MDH6568383.1 hypothetical protein [Streptomyces sp. SAI-117]MDH6586668.1 hypothetical protein [Streptomyces sp. SAI-133]MDH6618807.1 hypothetical protein [Streptomyces sp. SAI-135]
MRPMSFGQQGGPPSQWDPWKPQSQQPWSSGGGEQTPDWAALAEASEIRNKRRRLFFIVGGALATVGIGTAVAMAVVSANGSDDEANKPTSSVPAAEIPSASGTAPSFAPTSAPPPLDPKDFIASKAKDTAPLSARILFPGTQLTMGSTVYKKGTTSDTKNCAATDGVQASLGKILAADGCTQFMRVSYTKDGVSVTVGVAVFDTEAQAAKAKGQVNTKKDIVKSLSGGAVKPFCNSAICRTTSNSYGRYAYFTISGFASGKNVTEKDTAVFSIGDNLAEFTFRQIHRRGEAQASAAASE